MATKKNLQQMIEISDSICLLLYSENIGNCKGKTSSLKDDFRYELLKFASFLGGANGTYEQEELDFIHTVLNVTPDSKNLTYIKDKEDLENTFPATIPPVIKYAVLADAGKKIKADLYRHQKAQILLDTYTLFGQSFVATHAESIDAASKRLTDYLERLTKFLKEYGVFFTSNIKMYQPVNDHSAGNSGAGGDAGASGNGSAPSGTNKAGAAGNDALPTPQKAGSGEAKKEAVKTGILQGEEDPEKVEQKLQELDELIGLAGVKQEVHNLVNLIKVQKMREENGMKNSGISLHMVFSGNPGSGKTTVARMLGDIYAALGILSNGQLIEVDRSGLVMGYVAQTATRVQEVVDSALGGILFIDEAYSLVVNKGDNDFGQEAIDTLLKAMEDHRDDLVVIVAGYSDLMQQFLNSNPGLKSRFNHFIEFEDYTPEEMMGILAMNCKKREYALSAEAEEFCKTWMEERVANKGENFANARDVRNFLEKAIVNQASRVVNIEKVDKEVLKTIEVDDVKNITMPN